MRPYEKTFSIVFLKHTNPSIGIYWYYYMLVCNWPNVNSLILATWPKVNSLIASSVHAAERDLAYWHYIQHLVFTSLLGPK